mmetsp:Transcript_10124/g.27557  ORF Transcript_10124/g.27557 Transcript_10124/m.27557 type:complete len:258 (+) Transcript_10124:1172-1945(+)
MTSRRRVDLVGDALGSATHEVQHACRGLDGYPHDALAHALDQANGSILPEAPRGLHHDARDSLHDSRVEALAAAVHAVHDSAGLLRAPTRPLSSLEVLLVEGEVSHSTGSPPGHFGQGGECARHGATADVSHAVHNVPTKLAGGLGPAPERVEEEVLDARPEIAHEGCWLAQGVDVEDELVHLADEGVLVLRTDALPELAGGCQNRLLDEQGVEDEGQPVDGGDVHRVAEELLQHALGAHVGQVHLERAQLEAPKVP